MTEQMVRESDEERASVNCAAIESTPDLVYMNYRCMLHPIETLADNLLYDGVSGTREPYTGEAIALAKRCWIEALRWALRDLGYKGAV